MTKNNLFENYIPKCNKVKRILISFNCFPEYKKVSHLPSQLGIFVFTFMVKRFHIYGALLHLALKVFTFTGPYNIFTFRGATSIHVCMIIKISSRITIFKLSFWLLLTDYS